MFYPPYVLDPSNSSRLLLGTDKVYESTNQGTTWTARSGVLGSFGSQVLALAVAPNNSNVIYVTYTDGSVWVSTNNGQNWTRRDTGLPTGTAAPALRMATTDRIPERPVLADPALPRSSPWGDIVIDPTSANTAYLVRERFGQGHVFKTTDGGQNWADISGNLPDIPVHVIVVDERPAIDVLYVGTDIGVYRSTNGGTTWTELGTNLPNTLIADLELHRSSNTLIAATHGRGIWSYSITTQTSSSRAHTVVVSLANLNSTNFNFGSRQTSTGTPEIEIRGNSVAIVSGDTSPSTADFTDFGNRRGRDYSHL